MLILASSSPRRREMLHLLDVEFTVDPADVDEQFLDGEDPRDAVLRLAIEKGEVVSARHPGEFVLAADTVIALDDTAMGKPADIGEAQSMLRRLSGRAHTVHTGMALVRNDGRRHSIHTDTAVRFRDLTEDEIAAYSRTGEPLGKAGAYAVQGLGGTLVEAIEGELSTVVGLSLSGVACLLNAAGLPHALCRR